MCLDVADTAENAEWFGRPGVNKGEQAAFPQVRLVALAECGTHAIFDAEARAAAEAAETMPHEDDFGEIFPLENIHQVIDKHVEGDVLGQEVRPFTQTGQSRCVDLMISSPQ